MAIRHGTDSAQTTRLKGDYHTIEPGTVTAAMLAGDVGSGGPHTHTESDVTSLTDDLAAKATSSHNHDATYAPTHSHPYAATSHAHVDGDLPAGLARDAEVAAAYSLLSHTHAGGDHPDLATHDTLGLATDAELATHAATPHGGSLPAGIIAMWGGLLAAIPSGWALCDGQNGTPDLTDRFIKGASGEPGTTGGAATHTHDTHTAAGAHTHDAHTAGRKGGTTNPQDIFNAPATHASDGGHTHNAHSASANEPAYYALAFIQKL